MCNDAIRIAIQEDASNRFNLIEKAYPTLKNYGLHSHYIQNACEVAFGIYRRWRENLPDKAKQILTLPYFEKKGKLNELLKRRIRIPSVKNPFLKLDNQTYRLNYLLLRIPTTPKNFIFLTLDGSLYHRSFLADKSLKRGSVTITGRTVIIAFSKEIVEIETRGQIGIDVNERNITWSDTSGLTKKEDTSEIVELKKRYRHIRAKIAQKTQRDRRIQQRFLSKYGKRERDRTLQRLHRVSKTIVQHAEKNGFGIAVENLKGIRKLYRKGNGQGASFRGRMNSWMFREAQRQIQYKAEWEGIPVKYVNPRGTSRNCLCGSHLMQLEGRKMLCPSCKKEWDRDVIASLNIMAAPLVRAAQPSRGSGDGGTRRLR